MDQYLQVLLAFLFVIGLIGLLSFFLRRFATGSFLVKNGAEVKRTLSIVEILPLDTKRRLVLVKRGGKTHLLLLGMTGDLVLESFDE